MIDSELNRLYMPSQSIPNAKGYFESWVKGSQAARDSHHHYELRFGEGAHEVMDVFEPETAVQATLMFIHGGYWRAFYKDSFSYMAPPLLAQGIRVAVPSYDLLPEVSMPTLVQQLQRATSKLYQHLGSPLVISGHSAGGHLAAMLHSTDWHSLGLIPPEIVASIGISGLYDLEPLTRTELHDVLHYSEAELRQLSPIYRTPTSSSPFVLAVGELESTAFHEQSEKLSQVWQGVASPVHVLQGKHHFDAPDELLHLTLSALRLL